MPSSPCRSQSRLSIALSAASMFIAATLATLLLTPAKAHTQGADSQRSDASPPVMWRWSSGGHLQERPNGVIDLGVRRGPWSAELLTDTLDLRFHKTHPWGRWWVGGRAAAFAAQMLFNPWEDGAFVPDAALGASYLGVDAGVAWNLPRGLYLNATAQTRAYRFFALPITEVSVPAPVVVTSPELTFGWWRSTGLNAALRVGFDQWRDTLAPKASASMVWRPSTSTLTPWIEAHVGSASRQDVLTRTRVGGVTPYAVPLAGAAWAEFLAEDYAVLRLGPSLNLDSVQLAVVADLAWMSLVANERRELGLAFVGRYNAARFFIDLSAGGSPTLARPGAVPAMSMWVLVGRPWSPW